MSAEIGFYAKKKLLQVLGFARLPKNVKTLGRERLTVTRPEVRVDTRSVRVGGTTEVSSEN